MSLALNETLSDMSMFIYALVAGFSLECFFNARRSWSKFLWSGIGDISNDGNSNHWKQLLIFVHSGRSSIVLLMVVNQIKWLVWCPKLP